MLDPKYAVPLLFYQPVAYVGFGICYGVTRLVGLQSSRQSDEEKPAEPDVTETKMSAAERKRATFAAMTDPGAVSVGVIATSE